MSETGADTGGGVAAGKISFDELETAIRAGAIDTVVSAITLRLGILRLASIQSSTKKS